MNRVTNPQTRHLLLIFNKNRIFIKFFYGKKIGQSKLIIGNIHNAAKVEIKINKADFMCYEQVDQPRIQNRLDTYLLKCF